MRKLASIQKIKDIRPIRKADKIEVATVRGWDVVIRKDSFKVGDKVVYCEVDSFLPIEPEFEFLRKSSYKKMNNGDEGFRLKTIRMRGQVSQGLIINLEDAQKILDRNNCRTALSLEEVGTDVTELLGIIKYEKPIPACLSGKAKSYFPSFISQTDQERIQNLEEDYDELAQKVWWFSEKLDGSSTTYYIRDGEFGVCSRNLELYETEDNTLWKVARELDIEDKLHKYSEVTGQNLALQGEMIGEGIQGNPYRMKGQTVKFFAAFDIDNYSYLNPVNLHFVVVKSLGLELVPNVGMGVKLSKDVKSTLQVADGMSRLNFDVNREGIVAVNMVDGNQSFKVISNEFLIGEK